ncbi:BadF/BadG/BcrA/BcrD ATPase family protein [Agromyces aurantiacus]|uniref:BadF/BadG/BcrA/BcrD ATPase family protein n=1 Tax=Agromyces aurantiacus TaxID=165814 RepID=A0ABV9R5E9_9MICO|nr:BadF/BadG/BcrA/BcrD ATPase family protein [Agromyces aurantiacus]MBM7505857.1 N-acetylglucosamine kinase-like BadF-type ATPase [Agromyces aurantiacus]
MTRLLGIDLGGTGARVAILRADGSAPAEVLQADGVRVGPGGSNAASVALDLVRRALTDSADDATPPAGIGIGASGLASLVTDHDGLLARVAHATGCPRVAVAADAVTAHLGALGGAPGAVLAVGTGAIALGTDFVDRWVRVGGWGHLYDDRGSGAWIGIRGLEAGIRAFDRIDPAGEALRAAAVGRFGPEPTWTALLTREDRAGALAGFARDVAGLADAGDAEAGRIVREAGRLAGETLAAALQPGVPRVAAATGGLLAAPGGYRAALEDEFARLAPDADLRAPAGAPLDGAIRLAALAAAGAAPTTRAPFLWTTPAAAGA